MANAWLQHTPTKEFHKPKMFIISYELAKSEKNEELKKFCTDVLETYEKHNINGHIVWKK